MQLIPRERLENDFPAALLQESIHWLNLTTSVMEVRPLNKPWESSSENWSVNCTPGRYCMQKGHKSLVDVRSESWTMVSSILQPLDSPQNLLVTASPIDPNQPSSSLQLSVVLPRYGLSFYVDEDGDLQSHNIRGMVYDENQSVGTFFGLVNQLVLRPKLKHTSSINTGELVSRCVLIPDGTVSFRMDGHHVHIEIDTHGHGPTLQRATYQTYRVNTDLGCLTGNVSLTNKLYHAYLHALTSSGCSIDPLTGRSGTEEALSLLRSASCRSLQKFNSHDAELLCSIASLCPARSFHPRHTGPGKSMQTVQWLDLPARSQNHHLYAAAKEIKEDVEKVQFFHDSSGWEMEAMKKFPSQDHHLFTRSLVRASQLLPSEVSEQLLRADRNIIYLSRDLIRSDSVEHRAYVAASAVFQWSVNSTTITVMDVVDLAARWKSTLRIDIPLSFSYHSSWLKPDFPLIWLKAYTLLRDSKNGQDRFKLLFSLSSMAYGSEEFGALVPTLLAFAVHPAFRLENPPTHLEYVLSDGYQPSQQAISDLVTTSAKGFYLSPESSIPARLDESSRALGSRRRREYKSRLSSDERRIASRVVEAWPSSTAPTVSLNPGAYHNQDLNTSIQDLFRSCSRNVQFRDHLTRVREILHNLSAASRAPPKTLPCYKFDPTLNVRFRTSSSVNLDQLIFTRPPPSLESRDQLPHFITNDSASSLLGVRALQRLIAMVHGNPKDVFQSQYASDLENSATHFFHQASQAPEAQLLMEEPSDEAVELLVNYYMLCRDSFANNLGRIREVLGPSNESDEVLARSGQWPRITGEALFQSIASTSPIKLTAPWRKCIIQLALQLLELQRARRLLCLAVDGHHEEFYKELGNGGCDGWDPTAQPDWLLIQVRFSVRLVHSSIDVSCFVQLQGNFLIRRIQVDIANEMVSPRSGENTAMQLNMGEGKSSVIVPISVAKLATGDHLVRVVVPKALTTQMFQILVDRLGGLANRPIYYLPFSRSLSLAPERVDALWSLMSECKRKCGVLVVQPDHVLSLKLVTIEKQLFADKHVAPQLLELQKWLYSHSRDILDESDEILHVRYQLVYTISNRWRGSLSDGRSLNKFSLL